MLNGWLEAEDDALQALQKLLAEEDHILRVGHARTRGYGRVRITIAAPNGAQPVWSFSQTKPALGKTAKVWIAFSKKMPSSLILPVVPGVSVPTGLPPCPGLRNEPCRPYQAITNRTGHPVVSVPNGFSRGSPTALHLTGKLFGEAEILLLAHAFQAKTDFHLRHPRL